MPEASDEVDEIVAAWSRERPELDFSPLQVFSRLDRLSKLADHNRRLAFELSGLEPWEFDVLSALSRSGEPYVMSPKSLLRQTFVSSGTMTNRIDRLVARGLVERRTDPHDRRGVLVHMTREGLSRADAAIGALVEREREALEGLSPADRRALAGLLRRLGNDLRPTGASRPRAARR
ncbi:MAG TPA: MarR family transcriptional regulator [Microbacteriaceae bacterium]|nr:MarR family transcriptional regulator [Microbacteriaceae bacterium]